MKTHLEGESYRAIPISRGFEAIVDVSDYELVMSKKWSVVIGVESHTRYAKCSFRDSQGKKRQVLMHRFILGLSDPRVFVDHRNRNGLDNRRSNLRIADDCTNQANTKIRSDNTSGYRGVRHNAGKWVAQIKIDRQWKYLGRFKTPEEAARAYDAKAVEVFGEFVTLNFPEAGLSEAAPDKEK